MTNQDTIFDVIAFSFFGLIIAAILVPVFRQEYKNSPDNFAKNMTLGVMFMFLLMFSIWRVVIR